MDRFVVVSGCSGGGKSTLIAELARRGHVTVAEPGRRIVERERASGGLALPWVDLAAFARAAIAMALADRAALMAEDDPASGAAPVFFDRGLVDAAAALEHASGEKVLGDLAAAHRYNPLVFMTPPWPEIYTQDPGRRHGFQDALAEYERLLVAYPAHGYEVVPVPRTSVPARADFVLERLGL
jgi:predicted ATPase